MERTGMVVKVLGDSCILLTSEGEYKKIPLPVGDKIRIGQIIKHQEIKRSFFYLRYFAAAASILLVILLGQFYLGRAQPAVAFVTIDINPSIELAVLADGTVASARGLNSDGTMILEKIQVQGINVHEAVKLIVDQAVTDQFLVPHEDENNIVLVTLTASGAEELVFDVESIYESVKKPVEAKALKTEVIVEPVETAVRQEAEKAGISAGRYLVLQKTAQKGVVFDVGEMKSINLGRLEKEKQISINELLRESNDKKNKDTKNNRELKATSKKVYFGGNQQNYIEREKERKAGSYYPDREKTGNNNNRWTAPGQNKKNDNARKDNEKKDNEKKDGKNNDERKETNWNRWDRNGSFNWIRDYRN